MPSDVIDLLLPRASEELAARARSVVQYLSLVRDHARPVHASTTAVTLERAQALALSEEQESVASALEDLITHCVRVALGDDTFLPLAEPRLGWEDGWRTLRELLDVVAIPVALPEPGETCGATAHRLCAALRRLSRDELRAAFWEGCANRIDRGAAFAETGMLQQLQSAAAADATVAALARLVAGIAALRLDRGAVRQARALLDDRLALAAADPVLARFASWCAWLLGDVAAAEELARGSAKVERLPVALREWSERGGPSADLLGVDASMIAASDVDARRAAPAHRRARDATTMRSASAARVVAAPRSLSRSEFGAAVLILVRLEEGEPSIHGSDCSPGLRAGFDAWSAEHESSHRTAGEPEQQLVAGRCPVVDYRKADAPLRACLAGHEARALALEPVSVGGQLLGWLRLEFEHHLVPSRSRLEELAAACATLLDGHSAPNRVTPPPIATRASAVARIGGRARRTAVGSTAELTSVSSAAAVPSLASARRASPSADEASANPAVHAAVDTGRGFVDATNDVHVSEPRVECLKELVHALEMKMAQRRWWAFDVRHGRARLLCTDGGEFAAWREQAGGAQALARALQCQGSVWFDEADASQGLHAASTSGFAVAICWNRRVLGAIAFESLRRRDFRGIASERLEQWRQLASQRMRAACFRSWHQKRFGHDVHADLAAPGMSSALREIFAVGRARRPVALHGPSGCGKRVLARLLHHEAGRAASPLLRLHGTVACAEHALRQLFGSRRREGLWQRARGGTLVVEHVSSLPPLVQRRLHEALEAASREAFATAPRLVATSQLSISEAVATGALLPCLADHFDGLQISVPSLAQRRDEIPALARHFLARLAAEEGLDAPQLEDSCVALLWRQDWPGNLRELEQFLYRLAVLYPGKQIDADELARAAERHRLDLSKRITPRQADRELVSMALGCTRKQNGTFNKTRAAYYLGWDTETLVARMREFEAQGTAIADAGDGA